MLNQESICPYSYITYPGQACRSNWNSYPVSVALAALPAATQFQDVNTWQSPRDDKACRIEDGYTFFMISPAERRGFCVLVLALRPQPYMPNPKFVTPKFGTLILTVHIDWTHASVLYESFHQPLPCPTPTLTLPHTNPYPALHLPQAHRSQVPMCSASGGTSVCTKALAVALNGKVGMHLVELIREDYPAGSYESASTDIKNVLDDLTKWQAVFQGNFSTTHTFYARLTKTTLCTSEGVCSVAKNGYCVKCPYPAKNGWAGNGAHGNDYLFDTYVPECLLATTAPCPVGTGESAAFTQVMMSF